MLKLKYQMGNTKINIVGDIPDEYLDQLGEVNIKYYSISDTKPNAYNKPHFCLTHQKGQNFHKMFELAREYKVPLIHLETEDPPNIRKSELAKLLTIRANINVFTNKDLANKWKFDEDSSIIIPYGYESREFEKQEGMMFSEIIPVKEILGGALPIIKRTPYHNSIFTEFKNCFMYSSDDEKKYIYAKISNMDKEDILNIQKNAEILVKEKFPKQEFVSAWQSLIERILR